MQTFCTSDILSRISQQPSYVYSQNCAWTLSEYFYKWCTDDMDIFNYWPKLQIVTYKWPRLHFETWDITASSDPYLGRPFPVVLPPHRYETYVRSQISSKAMNAHTITTLSVWDSICVHNVTRTFQPLLFVSLFQTFQLLPIHGQNAKRHSDNRGAFLGWDLWWTWEAKCLLSVNLQRQTHIWPFEQVGLPSAWWRRHPRRLEGECGGALVAQEGHAPSGGGKLGQEGLTDEQGRTRSWERAPPGRDNWEMDLGPRTRAKNCKAVDETMVPSYFTHLEFCTRTKLSMMTPRTWRIVKNNTLNSLEWDNTHVHMVNQDKDPALFKSTGFQNSIWGAL